MNEKITWYKGFDRKKILVTGGTGLVGSAVLSNIIENSDPECIVAIHLSSLSPERLKLQKVPDSVVWCQGSLIDYRFLARTVNAYEIDTIIHLGAESIVRIASRDPITCFETNVKGTWNLLEIARNSKTVECFIGASSDKAYGVHNNLPYKEDFALKADHTYDASKAMADILIRTYAKNYGLNTVVIRPCNIYGPGDFNFSRIIPNSIRRLLEDTAPIIWTGVHDYIREFIYIDDVVNAIAFLTTNINKTRGNAYNISSQDIWRVEDLVNFIAVTLDKNIKASIVDKSLEFMEIPEQYLDNTLLTKLGWKSFFTVKNKGMEETVKWHEEVFNLGIK